VPPSVEHTPGAVPPFLNFMNARCFVCKRRAKERHPAQPGLCAACGALCDSRREAQVELTGRVALVTGARVGIGYATVLRLLRAGASVIGTTRFPKSAAHAYAAEPDYAVWQERLHLCGLELKQVLAVEAQAQHWAQTLPRLDLLINNAAQTVRPSVSAFAPLIAAEEQLPALPTVQGTSLPSTPDPTALLPPRALAAVSEQTFNSWLMKDEDVSALELVEVQIVNAVAPFLLTSRLKPLLAQTAAAHGAAFVVQVSSMEGRFAGKDKPFRHPHTNMAKAALHMFVRTSAQEYVRHGILMNAVDPGWVSLQHPTQQQQNMRAAGLDAPFGPEDAAARLTDPLYRWLTEGERPYGQLWKDYSAVDW